jgi:hypothetical protein
MHDHARALMILADYAAVYGCTVDDSVPRALAPSPPVFSSRSLFTWCPFSLWLTLRFVCRRLQKMFEPISVEFIAYLRRRLYINVGPIIASAVLRPREDFAPRPAEADFLVNGAYLIDLINGFDIGGEVGIVAAYTAIYTRVPASTCNMSDNVSAVFEYTSAYERLRMALSMSGPATVMRINKKKNPLISSSYKWSWDRRSIVQVNLVPGVSAQQYIKCLQRRPRAAFDGVRLFIIT